MKKKIKVVITHWFTGQALFEYESVNNTIKKTLEKAVSKGADLRGANLRGAKGLKMYWHIHHMVLVENLTEPLKNRTDYIKSNKPKDEVKLRLKLIKKVKAKVADYPTSKTGWEKLHKIECGCGWSVEKQTILTKKNGYKEIK